MIFWRRWGILSLIIPIIIGLLFNLFFGDGYPPSFGYIVGGLITYFLGIKWNRTPKRTSSRNLKGKKIIFHLYHDFFWIRMQYWGLLSALFGILLIIEIYRNNPNDDFIFQIIGIAFILVIIYQFRETHGSFNKQTFLRIKQSLIYMLPFHVSNLEEYENDLYPNSTSKIKNVQEKQEVISRTKSFSNNIKSGTKVVEKDIIRRNRIHQEKTKILKTETENQFILEMRARNKKSASENGDFSSNWSNFNKIERNKLNEFPPSDHSRFMYSKSKKSLNLEEE